MINYDKKLNTEINRVVRNFNAKINRLIKEGNSRYLPNKISVADLKSVYFERDALKRRLAQLERFAERGAEQVIQTSGGAKITRWELSALQEEREYLRKRYTSSMKRYGNIIPTVLGKKQAVNYARMGDAKYENLRVMRDSLEKDITLLDQTDLNRIKQKTYANVKRYNRQKYVLWANYFTFLDDIAFKAGIDEELLNSIKDKLAKMDVDDFMQFFDTEKAFSSVIDYYNIQKLRADGYTSSDIDTIKLMFESINQIADEYIR